MTVSLVKVECPTCGSAPMGTGCYHICPNSTHYYTPEQERDDALFNDTFGRDHITEAYAGDIDPEYEAMCAALDAGEEYVPPQPARPQATPAPDDVPF